MSRDALDEHRLRRLIDVGRSLVSQLDLELVLHEVVSVAQELTGARYTALGILDEERRELERFIYLGIDEATRRVIGELPRGRGVLGVLIDDPRPLRLSNVGEHPHSYGFPPGHPPMSNFLGVPVMVRGEAYGNLYLTEKASGDFDEADEQAVTILAEWAGIAIDNARLYTSSERRRRELERAVRGLEATTEVARALGGETEVELVLETIAKRGRALIHASSLMILVASDDELVVAAAAGERAGELKGRRVPVEGTAGGEVFRSLRPERVSDVAQRLRISPSLMVGETQSAILVPLVFRGRVLGVIEALDRLEEGPKFDQEDERLLVAFAASAATAIATARSVAADRLRHSINAAEQERARWARELHDETLQGMAARRLRLSSALRKGGDAGLEEVVGQIVEEMSDDIESLRSMISELRPAMLDEIGLAAAVEALAERVAAAEGIELTHQLSLKEAPRPGEPKLSPELETTVYRVVQEALTNVAKHAGASRVEVRVAAREEVVEVMVRDDGSGFDQTAEHSGFGLLGMRERVSLLAGTLEVSSQAGAGTTVTAQIPKGVGAPGVLSPRQSRAS